MPVNSFEPGAGDGAYLGLHLGPTDGDAVLRGGGVTGKLVALVEQLAVTARHQSLYDFDIDDRGAFE